MTLQQYTNLELRDKLDTLNSLYKGLIKFDEEDIIEDMMNTCGMNK